MRLVRDEFGLVKLRVVSLVAINAIFHLTAELSNKSLNGPCSSISLRANGVSFDLITQFLEHVDLSKVSIAELHALKHVNHPSGSFSAGGALAARLVLVELTPLD